MYADHMGLLNDKAMKLYARSFDHGSCDSVGCRSNAKSATYGVPRTCRTTIQIF